MTEIGGAMAPPPRREVSPGTAARMLGIHINTAWAWIKSGRLEARAEYHRRVPRYFVSLEAVRRLLASRDVPPA